MAIIYKDGKPVVISKDEAGNEVELPVSEVDEAEQQEMTRRKFMRASFLGAMGAFLIGAGGTYLLFFWPKKVGTFGSKVAAGDVTQFPPGSVTRVPDGRFWLVRLLPEDGGGFMALYWKCVHLGCTVPWAPGEDGVYGGRVYKGIFHCPCHGSQYTYTGQNFAGPAPRPLDYMEVTIAGGKVQVNTGKISKRDKWDPSQQVKA
jgi:cytochrome b6-f complex iron-sulfur subunit